MRQFSNSVIVLAIVKVSVTVIAILAVRKTEILDMMTFSYNCSRWRKLETAKRKLTITFRRDNFHAVRNHRFRLSWGPQQGGQCFVDPSIPKTTAIETI